jgi:hypothetical protein
VAQPTFTAFEFHVAARINDIDGVITQDASWQVLGGVVSHPQFFITDLTKVVGALDLEIKTTGATAELRVEEQADGGNTIVATATLPDTGGAWQRFSFNNSVPPSAGKNTYELQGRLNGATAAEVRYVTLSLLENKL